ncbi:hypothetical protein GQ53DRAFT_772096 [Thozetella sp. PMI_491]|nr:hypothetical protein GQ53DRAFT_772096 [Thozetella sp. PMI_491]
MAWMAARGKLHSASVCGLLCDLKAGIYPLAFASARRVRARKGGRPDGNLRATGIMDASLVARRLLPSATLDVPVNRLHTGGLQSVGTVHTVHKMRGSLPNAGKYREATGAS